MRLKNERYRQIIFLILIICGTIFSYNTWFLKDDNKATSTNVLNDEINNYAICKSDLEAQNLFTSFIHNPENDGSINSLISAFIYWDNNEDDLSINKAINQIDMLIKDDSLKNKLFAKIGKYYISAREKVK